MAAAAAAKERDDRARVAPAPGGPSHEKELLRRKGRLLEIVTTAWNAGEVVATLILGSLAGSLALIAFGLDSLVEVFASAVVLWHLGGLGVSGRSRRAERLVAGAFAVLGCYLVAAGVDGLVSRSSPAGSPAGIGVLAVTVVAMVLLARSKRRVGRALPSQPLLANATMTLLDGGLAAGVLVALVLDLAVGWWWADPAAALLVAAVAIKEGAEGWHQARSR